VEQSRGRRHRILIHPMTQKCISGWFNTLSDTPRNAWPAKRHPGQYYLHLSRKQISIPETNIKFNSTCRKYFARQYYSPTDGWKE
jgi:hypothetical protein